MKFRTFMKQVGWKLRELTIFCSLDYLICLKLQSDSITKSQTIKSQS